LERNSSEIEIVRLVVNSNKSVSALAHEIKVAVVEGVVMRISRGVALFVVFKSTIDNASLGNELLFSPVSADVIVITEALATLVAFVIKVSKLDILVVVVADKATTFSFWYANAIFSVKAILTNAACKSCWTCGAVLIIRNESVIACSEVCARISAGGPNFVGSARSFAIIVHFR
jgi:hypothetical protein